MSPDQVDRRRASRERWRERHREQEAERIRHRSGGGPGRASGSPAPDVPDTPPDQAVDTEVRALRARVAELEAELVELRAYRDKDRERSRRNHERRRHRRRLPVVTGQRPAASGGVTGTPYARDMPSGTPEYERDDNTRGVSLAAVAGATRARDGAAAAAAAVATPSVVDPWTEPTVLELLASKNLLAGPTRMLMSEIAGQASTSNLREVLKFVTRQFATSTSEAAVTVRTSGRAGHAGQRAEPVLKAWIVEREAEIKREQRELLAARRVVV